MSNYYFSAIVSTGDSIFGGTSLYFDGNDYIYIQGNKEFNFSNTNFNVEMWIKPDGITPTSGTTGAYGCLATTATPIDNRGFLIAINPNYTISWAIGNAGATWSYGATSTRSVSPNSWNHISLTREVDTVGLYINGDLENFRNVSGLTLNNPNNIIQIGGRTLQNQFYKGFIDELRITTGISRYSLFDTNYKFYTETDPYYQETTLLLDYENNYVSDLSLNQNVCIMSGDAFISDLQKFLGKPSLILGEQTGYIVINSGSNSFSFGTGNFTIETWIHPINNSNLNYIPIIETRNTAISNSSFSFGINFINNKYVLDFFPRNGNPDRLFSNNPIPFNTWSYITLTRKNSVCSMYINGLKQSNNITLTGNVNCETESPIIGLSREQNYFNGYINDFRITKDCRYSDSFDYPRISAYKRNAIDPYYKNTVLLLKGDLESSGQNRTVLDDSYYNHQVTGSGIFEITQSGSQFGNGCLDFSSAWPQSTSAHSGGYIAIKNTELFNFENKDFTIEFWHRRKSGIITGADNANSCCAGWYGRIFTTYCSGGGFAEAKDAYINNGGINILMEKNSTTGSVYFRNNGDNNFISGTLNIGEIPENWTYYTLMRKDNIIAVYKSGIIMDAINVGNKNIFNNTSGLFYSPTINIGGTSEGYHSINGFIDSFRITNGYARYPSMFTGLTQIQQSEFTTLVNVNNFYDDEIISLEMDELNNKFYGPINSAKKISISDNGAGYFNGSGYLQISDNSGFDFNTGDFTIDFWFKNLSSNNTGIIFQTSSGNDICSTSIAISGDNNIFSNFSFSGTKIDTSLNLGSSESGVWNHFAITRNTGSFCGYKNGSLIDKKNFSNNLFWSNEYIPVIGGTVTGKCILGLIDEFRITNGVSRYTREFSPLKNIEISANKDKYFYKNILTLPFAHTNNSSQIKDYSIITKPINVINNIKTVDNIKFKSLALGTIYTNNLLLFWDFASNSTVPRYQASNYTIQTEGSVQYVNDGPAASKAARLTPGNRILLRNNLWNNYTGPYTSFTCSVWIRKNALNGSGQEAVYMGSFFGPMGFAIAEPVINTNLFFNIQTQNGTYNGVSATHNSIPPIGSWMNIVCVNDFSFKTIKLYFNGNLVATAGYSTLGSYYSNWNGIALNGSIRATNQTAEYGNNYDFALLSLWDRALNDAEITLMYNNPLALNNSIGI